MKKVKTPIPSIKFSRRTAPILVLVGLFVFSAAFVPYVRADRYQEQINALNAENDKKRQDKGILGTQASDLTGAINELQGKIDSAQIAINQNEAKMVDLQNQIKAAEEELAKQRDLLGQAIRTMYVEGDISTVEMLATSKDLSDFFDKQQYRESVNSKIKNTLDKINQLKVELNAQKEEVDRLLEEQKQIRADLANQRAEKDRVLALNKNQQASLEGQIKENSAKVEELRKLQIAANIAAKGERVRLPSSGTYPWNDARCLTREYDNGRCYDYSWGYNAGWLNRDTGYAYRNCTDWVAWRGGFRSGLGNAADWPDRARSEYGKPVKGTAAVNKGVAGGYGHVMYVEEVGGDGSIIVSDYNSDGRGTYDSYRISAAKASTFWYVYR